MTMMEKFEISWQVYLSVWTGLFLLYYLLLLPRIARQQRPSREPEGTAPVKPNPLKPLGPPISEPVTGLAPVSETSDPCQALDRFVEEIDRLISAARAKHYSKETFLKLATQLAPYLEKEAVIRQLQMRTFRYGAESCHLSLSQTEIDNALANPPPS